MQLDFSQHLPTIVSSEPLGTTHREGADQMFEPLADGQVRLTEELRYPAWITPEIHFEVLVPEGFISDGASIPRLFWSLIGPPIRSEHLIPAVVHDFLCTQAKTYPQRVMGDAVFFALLREHNVPRWKRCLMYLSVRFYGRFIWKRKVGA